MTVKCKKCSMNELCICIPSADECHVRKQSFNKAIDECLKILKDNIDYIETDEEDYRVIDIGSILLVEKMKGENNG